MKTENAIIARNYKFENKELSKATTTIVKATESAAKSLLKIASVMAEVDVAEELVTGEVITPDMTLRQIENAVKEYNHKDDAAEGEEEPAAKGEEEPAEPDEIALNFMAAKTALDRLIEMYSDDFSTAEILTEMKTRLEIIENGGAR